MQSSSNLTLSFNQTANKTKKQYLPHKNLTMNSREDSETAGRVGTSQNREDKYDDDF